MSISMYFAPSLFSIWELEWEIYSSKLHPIFSCKRPIFKCKLYHNSSNCFKLFCCMTFSAMISSIVDKFSFLCSFINAVHLTNCLKLFFFFFFWIYHIFRSKVNCGMKIDHVSLTYSSRPQISNFFDKSLFHMFHMKRASIFCTSLFSFLFFSKYRDFGLITCWK